MQKKFIYESTCVVCSIRLNIHSREQTKKVNTELLIVRITIKQFAILNPINYAFSFYRMSKEKTPSWLKLSERRSESETKCRSIRRLHRFSDFVCT